MSIPAYLVLGTPGSGRCGVVDDVIAKAMGENDFCAVFISRNEAPTDFDKKIASAPNAGFVHYAGLENAAEKMLALDENKITHVFYIADSTKSLADEVENFKLLVDGGKIRLARIWSLIDCGMLYFFQNETQAYADALSHFADCLLLSRRSYVPNKFVNDLMLRYEKMRQPHLVELVDKNFRVAHPIELLIEEARRITMIFDDFDPIDELDLDEENLPEEPFSLERKPDPYMLRLNNGMRAKPLPDVSEYAAKARELESAENENL